MAGANPFLDAALYLRLEDAVDRLEASPKPTLVFVDEPVGHTPPWRSAAVLAGSFNPLTRAHAALAEAALAQLPVDGAIFALSTRTVDKERPAGASLPDRLIVLRLHAQRHGRRATALVNRGLYVDQARIFRVSAGFETTIFVVGFDKIVQIFDPRYYDDREAALEALFGLARFAVAPREGAGPAALAALLDRPENRRFADHIAPLALAPDLAEDASSKLREALRSGAPLPPGLPDESRLLINTTHPYEPPLALASGETVDRYAVRLRLLRLAAGPRPELASRLAEALEAAVCDDPEGRRWRELLGHD